MRGWKISTYPVFQISMQDHRRQEWQTHTTLSNFCTVSQNEISKDNGKKRPLPLYPYTSKFPQQELRVSEEDTTQLLLHMVWSDFCPWDGFHPGKKVDKFVFYWLFTVFSGRSWQDLTFSLCMLLMLIYTGKMDSDWYF